MTRAALAGTALLALAACGRSPPEAAAPDIGNAASEAQADIDSYAANVAAGDFTPPAAPTAVPPADRAKAITPQEALAGAADNAAISGNTAAQR